MVYGKDMEPCKVVVEPKALWTALDTEAGLNTLITLKGKGPFDGKVVVLKELELDPIRRDPMHADFHAIDLKQKGSFMVPVVPVGKSRITSYNVCYTKLLRLGRQTTSSS